MGFAVLDVFSPGAPIDALELLAGRGAQIDRMIETVFQRGQHAFLYGERGVGKSSLANTFAEKLLGGVRTLECIPVNCLPTDDFSGCGEKSSAALKGMASISRKNILRPLTRMRSCLSCRPFRRTTVPIIILDEFDKISLRETRNLVANTIKNFSDRSVRATVIVVGVADSGGKLIDEHELIQRCLRQIPMQRMAPGELAEIVKKRLPPLGMSIQPDAAFSYVVSLSRGLPHYTHLFGQQAAKKTVECRQLVVELAHVDLAIPTGIAETSQTIRDQYHAATISPRKGNIYKEVLLAAALAQVDELGYFQPADLQVLLWPCFSRKTTRQYRFLASISRIDASE